MTNLEKLRMEASGRDPFFQQPRPVDHWFYRQLRGMLDVQPAFIRQARMDFAYCLDAPDTMPAGGLAYFAHDFDVYGAQQMEAYRETML